MDYDRERDIRRQRQLLREKLALRRTWCAIMVIVQADLVKRDHLRHRQELTELTQIVSARAQRVMWLNACRRIDLFIGPRKLHAGPARRQIIADVDNTHDTRRLGPLEHSGAVRIKGRGMNMSM